MKSTLRLSMAVAILAMSFAAHTAHAGQRQRNAFAVGAVTGLALGALLGGSNQGSDYDLGVDIDLGGQDRFDDYEYRRPRPREIRTARHLDCRRVQTEFGRELRCYNGRRWYPADRFGNPIRRHVVRQYDDQPDFNSDFPERPRREIRPYLNDDQINNVGRNNQAPDYILPGEEQQRQDAPEVLPAIPETTTTN